MECIEELLRYTTEIVSAHIKDNENVKTQDIPSIISSTYLTLKKISANQDEGQITSTPAVAIDESVFPDYIVCLEDGKKLKMLKRYLKTFYNLSIDDYKRKWGLPEEYPAVAPNYAKTRSNLAKNMGLGKKD